MWSGGIDRIFTAGAVRPQSVEDVISVEGRRLSRKFRLAS